jgi:hypothetical protein
MQKFHEEFGEGTEKLKKIGIKMSKGVKDQGKKTRKVMK